MKFLLRVKKLPWLRIQWLKVKSFKVFCLNVGADTYKMIHPAKDIHVYPIHFIDEPLSPPVKCRMHEHYLSIIENARVIGRSNIVIAQNTILYDILALYNYRITDNGLIYKKFCPQEKIAPIKIMGGYLVRYFNYGFQLDEAISLVGNYSYNFYHYVFEFVQKFYLIDKLNIPTGVPILIDSVVSTHPQFVDILNMMKGERPIVLINHLESYKIKKLYYPSFVHMIPPNYWDINLVRSEDNRFDEQGLKYLRAKFLEYARNGDYEGELSAKSFPEKIFISRKVSKNRSYNESEIIELAVKYGYKVVCPEEMTIREQFAMFANVDAIIAASGAALSNIICCKTGCDVLVLTSGHWNLTIFSNIAGHLGVNMRYLCGNADSPNELQTSFTVDKDIFINAIK